MEQLFPGSAHGTACLSATAAQFRAIVVPDRFARFRASLANFRASAARDRMKMGMPDHEIMAGAAHLHAIHQNPDVVRVGMRPAFFEAVVNRMKTGIAAVFAMMDAFVHLR
jgi:hypothetical protein